MTGGPVSQIKEYLRQFSHTGANTIDTLDDGSTEVSLRATDLQALIFAAESVAREQRAHWLAQYAEEDAGEPVVEEVRRWGAARPFLGVVAAGLPHPLDVEIPDPVAFVLIAKGWTPPDSDQFCPRPHSTPRKHDFLPHTKTCARCGQTQKETPDE